MSEPCDWPRFSDRPPLEPEPPQWFLPLVFLALLVVPVIVSLAK